MSDKIGFYLSSFVNWPSGFVNTCNKVVVDKSEVKIIQSKRQFPRQIINEYEFDIELKSGKKYHSVDQTLIKIMEQYK